MAVNKNFVVKNGLEVDTNTLFVDSANNRVAIGTTVPTATLDVRGKILSDSQVESWVGKFVGIVTAGAVGVTTLTYSVGTGSSTKLGRANAEELNVTAGFTTFLSASGTDIIVSSGSTFSKDLNVGAAATAPYTVVFNKSTATVTNGIFTAQITGTYMFTGSITLTGCTVNNGIQIQFVTSNRTAVKTLLRTASAADNCTNMSYLGDMDAADTATFRISGFGEAAATDDLVGGTATAVTYFTVYLAN